MSKYLYAATAVGMVICVAGNVLAGSISLGAKIYTEKTPSEDLKHELLAVPYPTEDVSCVIIAPDDVFFGLPGDPNNSFYSINLAEIVRASGPIIVTDLGWDVTINPLGASWYSEAELAFTTDTDPNTVQPYVLTAGSADSFANDGSAKTYTSAGLVNLIDAIGENLVSVDGILNIELWDTFADNAAAPDAELSSGSSVTFSVTDALTFETRTVEVKWIPEPASLCLLGFAGLVLFGASRLSVGNR